VLARWGRPRADGQGRKGEEEGSTRLRILEMRARLVRLPLPAAGGPQRDLAPPAGLVGINQVPPSHPLAHSSLLAHAHASSSAAAASPSAPGNFQKIRKKHLSPFQACSEDGGSLSRDFTVFYMPRQSCNGGPYVGPYPATLAVKDVCGVCDGTGDQCLDCKGEAMGDGKMVCEECVSPGQEDTAVNCGGSCDAEFVLTADDGEADDRCERNPELPAFSLEACDGQTDSGATMNECQICVGGTTGLPSTAGLAEDCPGECTAPGRESASTLRDGCSECGQERDICDACKNPEDPTFGKGAAKVPPLALGSRRRVTCVCSSSGCEDSAKLLLPSSDCFDILNEPDVNVVLFKDWITKETVESASCRLRGESSDLQVSSQRRTNRRRRSRARRSWRTRWTFAAAPFAPALKEFPPAPTESSASTTTGRSIVRARDPA